MIAVIILSAVSLFLLLLSVGTVGAGERGVHTRFSAVTGRIVGPGLYFKLPLVENVHTIDVRTQKDQVDAEAASKDLQDIHSTVAVNFHVDTNKVNELYQNIGLDYKSRVIDPAVQETVKAVTANYTAEELITKREDARTSVQTLLTQKLAGLGIVVDGFNIVNFDFSPSFNTAIEAKVTAEQNALAAKNKLAQVQYEAQQAVAEAQGKADAIKVEASAIVGNPLVIQLRYIEKWNGVLPGTVAGESANILLPIGK